MVSTNSQPTNPRFASTSLRISLLIVVASVLAYHGAFLLGHGTDSFFDLRMYQTLPLSTVAANPVFNRYPMWGLFTYPLLLAMPLWLSHTVVIAAHTLAAVLFFFLLRAFKLNMIVAALGGLLYLLWPAHAESLFWLSGGMFVFGPLFLVAGALLYAHGRPLLALPLLIGSMCYSEGLLLPTLFVLAVIALLVRRRFWNGVGFGTVLVALYAGFQALRYAAASGRDFSPYGIGIDKAGFHFVEWSRMAFGLASSEDVAWMWARAFPSKDVGLLLPPLFLVLALAVALGLLLVLRWLGREATPPAAATMSIGLVTCVLGYLAAAFIFLLIAKNEMQARYTSVAVLAIAAGAALIFGGLASSRTRPLVALGMLVATLLVGWSFYKAWSNVWVNGYPSHLLNQVLVEDIRAARSQSGVGRILVIDDPRAVGNVFALGRDWGYQPAGTMFIDPALDVRNELTEEQVQRPDFGPGMIFSDQPCVFLGWRGGQRFITQRVLVAGKALVLNCATGTVEPPGDQPPTETVNLRRTSRENLSELLGTPIDPTTLSAQLRARLSE